ncbi:hypothetical protein [Bradyrhizobium lablabi]|uniref:hypothetical protein n=1 Tax=Bradyrhizobium lablabi TaxID=722472 RepID=UPI001BA4694C|nr:hypothetical protein [Bradyrhizobium lablabi]MBR0698221.1 hypothetical protein [Bradyrhizobium lablabi]
MTKPQNTLFDVAGDMEDDILALIDFGRAITCIADSLGPEDANMTARLGWTIIERAQAVLRRQNALYHALHPSRAEPPPVRNGGQQS